MYIYRSHWQPLYIKKKKKKIQNTRIWQTTPTYSMDTKSLTNSPYSMRKATKSYKLACNQLASFFKMNSSFTTTTGSGNTTKSKYLIEYKSNSFDGTQNIFRRRYMSSYYERPSNSGSPLKRTRHTISNSHNLKEIKSATQTTNEINEGIDLLQKKRQQFSAKPKAFLKYAPEEQLTKAGSSSATELISRRGVFSRQHYGSVDQLPQSELDNIDPNHKRFRVENGESLAEKDEGTQKIALPYNGNQKLTVKQILAHFSGIDATSTKNPKEIFAADIQKDLLLLEEQEGSVNFKFGVVYMKPGQRCDDEMLSNEEASQDFEDFLDVLGERVRLRGWDRFRGGLDVKGDMTGKYSVYTLYEGHEIMFHVSTLLPFSKDNRQQVERKRHIGNDIVNIIFIDQSVAPAPAHTFLPTMFDPTWIKSQFTHIFAVVTKAKQTYRLAIFCDENVPPFGPTLPNPPEFNDVNMFREFLLVKLINAEKATFQTPIFSQKRERTLEMLIKDLHEDYIGDNKMNMLNRRAFSEVLYDVPRTSKLKEDARQIEFVRIGQALKLEAIVKGDAPTSIASASPCTIFKKPPWEPYCFYPTFPHRGSLAGDSFGIDDEGLFIATDDGTFLIKEDQSLQLVFDKTLLIRQLNILEEHGLVLIRGGSLNNRDAHRVHVFRLREFYAKRPDDTIKCRSRSEIKDRRIERTRGCHLFASCRANGGHLRLVVIVGRRMQLFQWKHTAAWASWCSENDIETAEGFIYQKEISLNDTPTIVTPLEGPTNTTNGGLICVGYRYHYEIVCDQTGVATRLHEVESSKRNQTQLTAAIELCDGLETELLLCYNHTCHFQKLNDKDDSRNEFDFHWNTSPTSVVCAFPYILGFTSDSMEIRLLVNGNLVHTAILPELQMITSKRDIFFVTTAPEFMSKDLNIRGLQIQEHASEKRFVTTPSECSSNEELTRESLSIGDQQICGNTSKELPINPEHEMNNLLEIPAMPGQDPPLIQRARSLQKSAHVEEKPIIAKSNSYGDSYNNSAQRKGSVMEAHLVGVPPNSPRNGTTCANSLQNKQNSPMSPTKRNSKYRNLFNSTNTTPTTENYSSSPDRSKPLRIYRIPLTKLTGTHSHFNMHSFSATNAAAKQNREREIISINLRDYRQTSIDVTLPLKMEQNE
ncbi:GTPase-activating Rap/Ran-GAP domain-like protein 3 isoform 3-T3 [Glossina fuscipes fuscipes]